MRCFTQILLQNKIVIYDIFDSTELTLVETLR